MRIRPGGFAQGAGFWATALLLAVAVASAALPAPALAQVDAKRAEAAALKDKIASQGAKLSQATEDFNAAKLERERIDAQASTAEAQVAEAEERWMKLRARLAERARTLYKHPAAAVGAWLGADSFSDLTRAHKFGAEVLAADAELVNETEAARVQLLSRADKLDQVRSAAVAKETELGERREQVGAAVSEQKALLDEVTGEIAELMEAERQAELEAARRAAEEAARQEAARAPEPSAPPAAQPGAAPDPVQPSNGEGPAEPEEDVSSNPPPPVKSGASKAVATAAAQIGKPYEWAAEGPDSYDCSGLTLYAWRSAGVSLPHSSRAQYASLPHVDRDDLRPGDLVFYGSPIHHVGIYEGNGVMINAPQTGEFVRRDSISRSDYVGAARP